MKISLITVTTPKPRNRWVALARFRRAGSHQPCGGAMRQQANKTLKRALDQLERVRHSP